MTSKAVYLGALRVSSTHLKSGEVVISDAPVDNNGKGEAFSPTDLVANSLASCMLTIMGIVAVRENIDIKGAEAAVTKTMSASPRRIAKIQVDITFPALAYSNEDKKRLELSARACPVAKSLHPDIEQVVSFIWL
jgi:putative redox protein